MGVKRKHIPALAVAAFGVAVFVFEVISAGVGRSSREPVPIFRQDLRAFGYVIKGNGSEVNYFDLNFLSEDSLLMSANGRIFVHKAQPLNAEGHGDLLLFDVARNSLIRQAEETLASDSNAVGATRDGKFVALDLSGVRLCSSDLTCGAPLATKGPIKVSPDGRMLIAGGNGQTDKRVLDSSTFNEIERFRWDIGQLKVSGTAILVQGTDLVTNSDGKRETRMVSFAAHAEFLSEDLVAGFTERAREPKKLVTQTLDGAVKYETILESSWYETKLIPALDGARFCIDEVGYNRFSLPDLLGYGDVPYHFERVRVLETETGKPVFELRWDPRPYTGYMTTPAISPDGHRLAIARHGFVEVFKIP